MKTTLVTISNSELGIYHNYVIANEQIRKTDVEVLCNNFDTSVDVLNALIWYMEENLGDFVNDYEKPNSDMHDKETIGNWAKVAAKALRQLKDTKDLLDKEFQF